MRRDLGARALSVGRRPRARSGRRPSPGSVFAGWSGVCTGTSAACVIAVTASRSVTAYFEPASPCSGFGSAPSAVYKLVNKTNGFVLDSGGGPDAGTYVKQWEDVESDHLRWWFSGITGGYYHIVNVSVGRYLDSGGVFDVGSWAMTWSDVETDNQRWQIVRVR